MHADSKKDLKSIFLAGVAAVDPKTAVENALSINGNTLRAGEAAYDLAEIDRIVLLGAGKGAAPMAAAVENVLGDRLEAGLAVVKYGHGLPLQTVEIFEAAHPVPDAAGEAAARKMLALAETLGPNDLLLCVLTGGASALFEAPKTPLTLADNQAVADALLACGAEIDEINAVRKHLSATKGGLLAKAAHPAKLAALIVSDVIGDDLSVIASGPTVPDPSTFADALDVVRKYHLEKTFPQAVLDILNQAGGETPKPGDPVFENVRNTLIAGNAKALFAAGAKAEALGYTPLYLTSRLRGEAREAAKFLHAVAREAAASGHPVEPPACILAGGETTVTLTGNGKGGRNQELALAFALALNRDPAPGAALLAAGTDGTDGPTDAAGGFATPETCANAAQQGLDPAAYLNNNDAYRLLQATNDLFITGPTRTNVMDLACLIVR